jgi:hypothetical protein
MVLHFFKYEEMAKVQKSGNLTCIVPDINVRTLYDVPVFRIQFVHLERKA